MGFWRLIFLKQCVLATSGLHSLFRRVFFWVALPSTPFVSLWIRPWSRQLRVWLAGLTPRPSVSGVSSGVFSDPHPDSDPHPNPKGLVNSNSHPNPHPGAVSAACGSQARLLAPLRLRRFPRHPCAQQCLDCSWLQICCLVFNDAALILDSQSTASFPPFIALSLGAHGPALWQKGLVSILRPLRRRLPAGRQPNKLWSSLTPETTQATGLQGVRSSESNPPPRLGLPVTKPQPSQGAAAGGALEEGRLSRGRRLWAAADTGAGQEGQSICKGGW